MIERASCEVLLLLKMEKVVEDLSAREIREVVIWVILE